MKNNENNFFFNFLKFHGGSLVDKEGNLRPPTPDLNLKWIYYFQV